MGLFFPSFMENKRPFRSLLKSLGGAYIGHQAASMAGYYRKRRRAGSYRGNKRRNTMVANKIRGRGGYSTVTTQKDFALQYRRKNQPKGKKIRWKKFSNKVKAVIRKELGNKTVLYNDSYNLAVAPAAQQATGLHLYGVRGGASGGNGIGMQDLVRLFGNDPDVVQGAGGNNPYVGKLLFNSAVLDVTLHNTGIVDLEVDIYYGYHRKDVISGQMVSDDFVAPVLEVPIKAGNVTIDILQRGATPFDCSTGLSQSGFHILRKQKMFIKYGQTAFLQYRDPRNHTVEWNMIKQCGYGAKKLTYTVLVVFKCVAGSTDNGELTYGVTRKYSYNVNEDNVDQSAINP